VRVAKLAHPGIGIREAIRAAREIVAGGKRKLPRKRLEELQWYGLVRAKGEEVEPTAVALRLSAPMNAEDYGAAVLEAALGVPIYQLLNEGFMGLKEVPGPEEFLAVLRALAGEDAGIGVEEAAEIRKGFLEIVDEVRGGER
jgi:hypothetical protein